MGRIYYNDNGVILDNQKVVFSNLEGNEPIYYGSWWNTRIDNSVVMSEFSLIYSFVGSPTGKIYTFSTGLTYKYWLIPWDLPNSGERVINYVTNNDDIFIDMNHTSGDAYYRYLQKNPTPEQPVKYGIESISDHAVWYRVYRTLDMNSDNIFKVYSF